MIVVFRAALLAVLVAVFAPTVAEGKSSDSQVQRIVLLERTVAALEERVRVLEALIKVEPSGTQPVPTSANWQELANWRRLRRGMTMDQVRALLGEPERVDASKYYTNWSWGGSGESAMLMFDEGGGLTSWSEPRR